LAKSKTVLSELDRMLGANPFLAASDLTLADLHALPMLAYFRVAPEGDAALARHASVGAWGQRMQRRPSVQQTVFARERT
jgi:glutathione S-transferase